MGVGEQHVRSVDDCVLHCPNGGALDSEELHLLVITGTLDVVNQACFWQIRCVVIRSEILFLEPWVYWSLGSDGAVG